MTPISPRSQLAIWAATVVLLVGGATGLATIDADGSTDETDVAASGPTTTAPADPTAGSPTDTEATTDAGGTPAGTAPGSASRTTARAGTSAISGADAGSASDSGLGAPQDPGPTSPPKAGSYRSRTTLNGSSQETEIKVVNAGQSAGSIDQKITFDSPQGPVESDVHWEASRAKVSASRFTVGDTRAECNWEPDFTQYALPLKKGQTWEVDSKCTITVNGAIVNVHNVSRAVVGDLARVKVGSTVVDCWTIDKQEKTETSGAFASTSEGTSTECFSPKIGLPVKSNSKGKSKTSFGERDVVASMVLLDASPR